MLCLEVIVNGERGTADVRHEVCLCFHSQVSFFVRTQDYPLTLPAIPRFS